MAYVKTIWIDDETVVNADRMNHIENGIKNLESISLLAVSDTAPSECVEGDLYYNTTTKKIYQAIDTDVWDTDGTDPLDKILYIVFSTKTTYSLDDNGDLISVGGGGAEISVSTTEPEEQEILWINPEETPSGSGFELNKFYPIGSIYINTTGVNPSTFMGGTWEAFGSGKVLVGQDTNDTAFDTLLETGGEKAVQLTTDNLASNVISTSTTGSNTDGYIMRGGYTASGTYNIGGSGVAHNNLQPYIVVSMWVRTA